MIDVLLIDNLFVSQTSAGPRTIFYPHLGLLSIAATLNRAGFGTRLLDPKPEFERYLAAGADGDFDLAFVDLILRCRPRLVGFTAYGLNFHHVATWVKQLRRLDPSIKIMLGGPHVSMLAEDIADFLPEVNMLVTGECEGRIVDAVDACLGDRSPEHGIAAVRNGVVLSKEGHRRDLPPYGPPDLELYLNAPDWNGTSLSFPLEAGRGCPFECTFCSTAAFFGRRYRVRSTQDLIGDILHLRERWGVASFDLTHDLFGLRRQFVREFCEQVTPLDIAWQCSMRPDQVTPELATVLAKAGCSDVYLGFETGSEHLQTTIKKRLELMPARRSARLLTRAGIDICSGLMPPDTSIGG